jgi:carbamoyltransferase
MTTIKAGGHDPAMAVMVDGRIVAAAEEERFIRKKHAQGSIPINAIKFGLKYANKTVDEVDLWVVSHAKPHLVVFRTIWPYLKSWPRNHAELRYAAIQIRNVLYFWRNYRNGILPFQKLFDALGVANPKVDFLEHHQAHNLSASMYSSISRGLAVSLDGKGDGTSLMVCQFSNSEKLRGKLIRNLYHTYLGSKLLIIKRFDPRYSLGLAYTSFTKYLGFEPNDAEYKVMGLASYGNSTIKIRRIFGYDNSGRPTRKIAPYTYNWRRSRHFETYFQQKAREPESAIGEFHKNLAASVQKELEQSSLAFISRHLKKSKEKSLVLSGGVCLNVKMNMTVRERVPFLEEFFVQPVSSDAGLALGCVAYGYQKLTGKFPEPMSTLHLGPHINDFDVKLDLISNFFYDEFENYDQLCKVISQEIASGNVVGWMQGNMELGPRSLGARSILADPRKVENRDRVNEKIKFRELFRPFCPSMLKYDFLKYVDEKSNWKISRSLPYMIEAFRVNELAVKEIPAVVHVDNTIRPQVLEENKNNPSEAPFVTLLQEFRKLTGIGVLLNTSLNRRGEPIACSPNDGLNIFKGTDLDLMVIGNRVFRKRITASK